MPINTAQAAPDSEAVATLVGPLSGNALPVLHITASVRGGFPSPAQDLPCEAFDLAACLAPHADTTFTLRVSGDSMHDAGIPHGCLIVVDRSLEPQHGHIVVACLDGEFTVKRLDRHAGRWRLLPAHPAFPPIALHDGQELNIWGVVRASVIEHVHGER